MFYKKLFIIYILFFNRDIRIAQISISHSRPALFHLCNGFKSHIAITTIYSYGQVSFCMEHDFKVILGTLEKWQPLIMPISLMTLSQLY